MLDFGCGSGILAIAALLLGAREAVGTDIDVQAIEASRDNAQRNGIADEKLALYLPEHMPAMQADVLVANILAGPLVSLAPQLSGLVRPGGCWHCRVSWPSRVRTWLQPTPPTSSWTQSSCATAGCASVVAAAKRA